MAKNRRRRQKENRFRQRNNGPAPQSQALPLPIPLERESSNDTKSDVSDKKGQAQQQNWSVRKLWASSKKVIVTTVGLLSIGGLSWLLSGVDVFYQSQQAKFAGEQVGVARQQLNSDERAVLSIAEIDADFEGGFVFLGLQSSGRRSARGITGTITETRWVRFGESSPIEVGTHVETFNLGDTEVSAGAAPVLVSISLHNYNTAEKLLIENRMETVFLMGEISYDDGVGGKEPLGFCRTYRHYTTIPKWETCGWAKSTGSVEEDEKKVMEMIPKGKNFSPPE